MGARAKNDLQNKLQSSWRCVYVYVSGFWNKEALSGEIFPDVTYSPSVQMYIACFLQTLGIVIIKEPLVSIALGSIAQHQKEPWLPIPEFYEKERNYLFKSCAGLE